MQPEEQITIKDVLLKIISIKNSILKNWKIVLLFVLVGVGIGVGYDYMNLKEPTYSSVTKFYLETASPSNDYGGFSSFIGGGQQSTGLFSGENLLNLIQSTDFVEKTLLREVNAYGSKEILANYFIRKNKIPTKEKDKEITKESFKPLPHTDKNKYGIEEFNSLGIASGQAITAVTLTPVEKTSFMLLEVKTNNDTLSKVYSDMFLQTLKEYFLDSKTGKIKTQVERQQVIVDSLNRLVQGNENTLARVTDMNQGSIFAESKVRETRLNRKGQILTENYREQLRILNNYKFQLYQDSPLFKITSPQRLPIPATKSTLTKSYKNGIIFGLFLSFLFIVLRDGLRAIMKEEKK